MAQAAISVTIALISATWVTIRVKRLARLTDQLHTLRDLTGRSRNQCLDLLGGLGRALGQRTNFGCDDGEAAARIAGTGGFDAGVQSQKVGLEGDLVDDADDLADLL